MSAIFKLCNANHNLPVCIKYYFISYPEGEKAKQCMGTFYYANFCDLNNSNYKKMIWGLDIALCKGLGFSL